MVFFPASILLPSCVFFVFFLWRVFGWMQADPTAVLCNTPGINALWCCIKAPAQVSGDLLSLTFSLGISA